MHDATFYYIVLTTLPSAVFKGIPVIGMYAVSKQA